MIISDLFNLFHLSNRNKLFLIETQHTEPKRVANRSWNVAVFGPLAWLSLPYSHLFLLRSIILIMIRKLFRVNTIKIPLSPLRDSLTMTRIHLRDTLTDCIIPLLLIQILLCKKQHLCLNQNPWHKRRLPKQQDAQKRKVTYAFAQVWRMLWVER